MNSISSSENHTNEDSNRLTRHARSGGAINVIGQGISLIIQILSIAVLSRLLTPKDFGLVAMSASVVAFIQLFRDMGLSSATLQKEEIDNDFLSGVWAINLGLGLTLMFAGFILAPITGMVFADYRVGIAVATISTTIPFTASASQHLALLRRNHRWITLKSIVLGPQLVAVTTAVILAAFSNIGFWALIAMQWLTLTGQAVCAWLASPWRPGRVENWGKAKSVIGFGANLTGANIAFFLLRQFDNVLIGWRWGETELGHYSRAYNLLMLPITAVIQPLSDAILSSLCRLQNNQEEWRKLAHEAMQGAALLSLPIATVMVTNTSDVVAIFLGEDWELAENILGVLGISMFARILMIPNPWLYISLGKTDRMLKWQLYTVPLYLAGFIYGLKFGAIGVAWAFSILQVCFALPSIAYASKDSPISLLSVVNHVRSPVLASLIAIAATTFITQPAWLSNHQLAWHICRILFTLGVYCCVAITAVSLDPFQSNMKKLVVNVTRRIFKLKASASDAQ